MAETVTALAFPAAEGVRTEAGTFTITTFLRSPHDESPIAAIPCKSTVPHEDNFQGA